MKHGSALYSVYLNDRRLVFCTCAQTQIVLTIENAKKLNGIVRCFSIRYTMLPNGLESRKFVMI